MTLKVVKRNCAILLAKLVLLIIKVNVFHANVEVDFITIKDSAYNNVLKLISKIMKNYNVLIVEMVV